jgi:putative membrane protein
MRFVLRWLILTVAVGVAAWLMGGIQAQGQAYWITIAVMALVLGLVNALVRPILNFLSCGCIVATLGLFILVINAFTFWFASYITNLMMGGGAYQVTSVWSALVGSVIVSIVSFALNLLIPDKEKTPKVKVA